MFKTLKYGWKVLVMLWQANGIYAGISIFSKIYSQTFFPLIQVILLAKLLDSLAANKNLQVNDLIVPILIYITAALLNRTLINLLNTRDLVFDYRLQDFIEQMNIKKLSTLDPATFENPNFQELLAQIEMIRYNMNEFIARFIGMLNAFVMFITAMLVIGLVFPLFIPAILLSSIPIYLALQNYRRIIYPFLLEERPKSVRFQKYLIDLFVQDSTSKEIAIFRNGEQLISKLILLQTDYMKKLIKALDNTVKIVIVADLVQLITFFVTQFYNLTSVLAGRLSIGQFSLIFQQTMNLAQGANLTLDHYSAANMRVKYLDQYFDFLNYPRFIPNPENPKEIPGSLPPVIEFINVSFKYPETDRFIFKDLNLNIDSGEKIALVGENGAGKSTLIKLLLRFYDPTEGEILLNGVNLKEIDLEKWHKTMGALFQDFIKYNLTFKENVYFGNIAENGNVELLKKAITKSGADSYLKDLPDGIDQVLGKKFDKGIDLSGGQWQKLALARAFFRDAPILILDEPTSAIDAKAEYEIFERVQRLQKDKTVIIISHRFSTVRNADRILVLDEGKIVEEGNHRKLMKENGLYAELFNIQAQGYK